MEQQDDPGGEAREHRHILVVEDDASVRRFLVAALEATSHAVKAVASGPEALRHVAEQPTDLVLLDVQLPDLDGLEVCRRIRTMPRMASLPVVLLTGHDSPEDVVAGLDAGADEFLSKPITPAVLRARLSALLRFGRRSQAETAAALPSLLRARMHALADSAGLSAREREVLDLQLLGRTADEIGTALGISKRTARFHLANVLEKLGAESRFDLFRLLM